MLWPAEDSYGARRRRPDTDALGSCIKPYFDGFNRIIWKDDRLVQRLLFEHEVLRHDGYPNGGMVIEIYEHQPFTRRLP